MQIPISVLLGIGAILCLKRASLLWDQKFTPKIFKKRTPPSAAFFWNVWRVVKIIFYGMVSFILAIIAVLQIPYPK